MATDDGAGHKPQGEGQGQGAAPPASESQGAGGKASGGEETVPKTRFIAALNHATAAKQAAEAEAARLREELERMRNPPKAPPTREELDSLVASGDLTRAQADKVWENQITERATVEAASRLAADNQARATAAVVDAQLAGYKDATPDAWVEGSPERAKVEREYRALIDLGYPPSRATEAAALRAAFGDLATLQASKSARRGPADTHSETGGGTPPGGSGDGGDGPPKNLTARERAYYEDKINRGIYRDWKQVADERKFAKQGQPKAGARA